MRELLSKPKPSKLEFVLVLTGVLIISDLLFGNNIFKIIEGLQ